MSTLVTKNMGPLEEPIERFTQGTSDKVIIRVRIFAGDIVKKQALQFSHAEELLVSDVTDVIAEKQGVPVKQRHCFSLWIIGQDLVLQLKATQDILDVVAKWHLWNEKYTHNPDAEDPEHPVNRFFFLYKREAMMSLREERKWQDENLLKLLYGEAKQNVLAGVYPITADDASTLAAIQCQIQYGDYDQAKHGPGFLAETLREYLPLYAVKGYTSLDFEKKIFGDWARNHGKLPLIGRLLYLQYCRQFPCYGSTFFPACRSSPPSGFFEQRREHYMIGINSTGVQIVDMDKHKMLFHGTIDSLSWENTPDTITFTNKSLPASSRSRINLYITPQSNLVNNLANKCYLLTKDTNRGISQIRSEQSRRNRKTSVSRPPALVKPGTVRGTVKGGTVGGRKRAASPAMPAFEAPLSPASPPSAGSDANQGLLRNGKPASTFVPMSPMSPDEQGDLAITVEYI